MRILAIGDHFIPADLYAGAYANAGGTGDIATVDWSGSKAEQHQAQQAMEQLGPNAVSVPDEVLDGAEGAEVLAVHFAPVSRVVLNAGTCLRAVCVARAGLENVDLETATARGIAVAGVRGRNASAVAELALGLMLSEARDIARADASVRSQGWRKEFGGPGREVGGSTIGLVGFGHVGCQFARRLRGFDVRVLAHDPYVDGAVFDEYGVEPVDLDAVFAESDFVHIMARLTAETERFITAHHFGLMKSTAYFVNTARSRLVDTSALRAALEADQLAGAGLDVFDDEPLALDDPLRWMDNVTFTTHFAGDTRTTNLRSARLVAESIRELERTGKIAAAVNAPALGWTR